MHVNSIHFLLSINTNVSVISLLSKQKIEEQKNASTALLTIISTLRYLSQMGISIRGHSHNDGNFISLLEERCVDVPCLRYWIQQRNNWLSSDIQNEILEIMSLNLQRELVQSITKSEYFSIIADSTTDISSTEQFSLCIRYVDSNFEVHEVFTGLYNTPDSKALTFFDTIKDILIRFTLSTSNLRGHCFDGAANMSGKLNGVKKLIENIQPKSCFVHCSNHSLDLALQEVARKNSAMCDTFTMIRDVSNAILESAKRKKQLAKVLQNPKFCASDSIKAADTLKKTLLSFRSNEYFEKILNTVNLNAEIYELEPLDDTKRIKKTPKRLQYTSNPPTKLSPICELKKDMFEIIDYLINEIDRRFNQQGLKNLVKLEHILVDQNTRTHQELTNCLNNMSEDFDINKLHAQLIMLPSIVSITSISDIINHLRNEYSNVKDSLFSEITKLIKLILTIPASAATAERSFSALRRLKTYLRSTMTQKRLTHLMILHVHKSMTAKIDLKLIAKEFVSRTSERKSKFGNFY
ncbi:zinc finger MYM-type protein 1-like [Myzus persicae]|nr:zinc finger MYM-type protein 1-like [Myzus persicae]